jgi:hypothetical protein
MSAFLENSYHWRKRAEETRSAAEGIRGNDMQKLKLLRVAEEYERLAQHAEEMSSARALTGDD